MPRPDAGSSEHISSAAIKSLSPPPPSEKDIDVMEIKDVDVITTKDMDDDALRLKQCSTEGTNSVVKNGGPQEADLGNQCLKNNLFFTVHPYKRFSLNQNNQ